MGIHCTYELRETTWPEPINFSTLFLTMKESENKMEANLKSALLAVGQMYSHEDLRFLNQAVVDQLRHVSRVATRKWSVGDQVEFDNKRGNREQGQITKINQKTINVKTLMGNWKVSAAMLRHVA